VIFDEGTCKELYSNIKPTDPLEFKDTKAYKDRLAETIKKQEWKMLYVLV